MKVKDLIARLQLADPEAVVVMAADQELLFPDLDNGKTAFVEVKHVDEGRWMESGLDASCGVLNDACIGPLAPGNGVKAVILWDFDPKEPDEV